MSIAGLRDAVARDRAQRPPAQCDSALLGRYVGRLRAFELEWDDEEHGYRRRFEPPNARVLWDEHIAYSAGEVRQKVASGEWRRKAGA